MPVTVEDYIRRVVDRAPPLSAHQRAVIRRVFADRGPTSGVPPARCGLPRAG